MDLMANFLSHRPVLDRSTTLNTDAEQAGRMIVGVPINSVIMPLACHKGLLFLAPPQAQV